MILVLQCEFLSPKGSQEGEYDDRTAIILKPLPMLNPRELMMWKTQNTGPRIVEMHIKETILVTLDSRIFIYTEKCLIP